MTNVEHRHPWPGTPLQWDTLSRCMQCGVLLLALFRHSPTWVVRRVENVAFVDDRTIRRCVSIDYEAPPEAVVLGSGADTDVRLLPLAILRRKSLINFDFRDEEGNPLPLVGLRQNQALTLAVIRAWAGVAAGDGGRIDVIGREADLCLDDIIAGDQGEMRRAYAALDAAEPESHLAKLAGDPVFRVALDRFAENFILFHLHRGAVAERRVVKFSYDEPFTVRYFAPTYHRESSADGRSNPCEKEQDTRLRPWSWWSLRSAMGLYPTQIEFPVPAAELAASFHFQIAAPPDVTIAGAALLAGRPSLTSWEGFDEPEPADGVAPMRRRVRQRPSFDRIGGGYPTVDLHVSDVPYGSRSHARVEVEAQVSGWFAAAALSTWVATGIVLLAWLVRPKLDVGSAILMSSVAAYVAVLVRPDQHRMVTRLLSKLRLLAATVALISLSAAALVAFGSRGTAHRWLGPLFLASLLATFLVSFAWLRARRRLNLDPQESPWEHHRPRRTTAKSTVQAPEQSDEARHEELVRQIETSDYPYDKAFAELGFDQPAIRVASSEGTRTDVAQWDRDFARQFDDRLRRLSAAVFEPERPPQP